MNFLKFESLVSLVNGTIQYIEKYILWINVIADCKDILNQNYLLLILYAEYINIDKASTNPVSIGHH